MPSINDFPARGQIKQSDNGTVVFAPAGTNYELHLKIAGGEPPPVSPRSVDALIRVSARKVWTVPSGGNFIQPIFGSPRIIQGWVKWLDEQTLIVHAGTNFVVDMPPSAVAVDLANGTIKVGTMVNVTVLPGAMIELRVPQTAST